MSRHVMSRVHTHNTHTPPPGKIADHSYTMIIRVSWEEKLGQNRIRDIPKG